MHFVPPRREALVCLLVCLAASPLLVGRDTSAAGAAPPEPGGCGVWLPPVDGPVVRAFQAPAFAYGPGHRGIDFTAPPGTPVRASGDGVVAFAGSVAGSLHVVVAHDGNLRTTYAFLAGIGVHAGDRVARGQVVGTAGATAPEHDAGGLHFGVRLGDRYVDPQRLFATCDLTQLVRLIPADEPPAEPWDSRRVVAGSLTSGGSGVASVAGDLAGALGDAAGVAADAGRSGWDAMSGATGAAASGARAVAAVGARAGRGLVGVASAAVGHSPAGIVASVAADVAAGAADWWRHRQECSDGAAADGTGGSGHLLMAVGGIDTAGAPDEPTFGLDTRALGYRDGEVRYFSYAPDGGAYRARQTHGDLQRAGLRLAEQLKQAQREHPGREVDLIAHSQGGVVVDVFLQDYYDAADPAYPPIGTIVTLSSPHEGAPLATAAADWRASPVGRALVEAAEERLPVAPSSSATSVRQLDEHSRFLRDLWDDRLPEHVDFTTIGASDDVLVPATQVDVPDATKVVVDVGGGLLDDHTNIPRDPGVLRVVRAALEGRAPPCVGVAEGLRSIVVPTLITRVEHGVGELPVVSR
jgi:hypothetical protein